MLAKLLQVDLDGDPTEVVHDRIVQYLAADPELATRAPLLNDVLHVGLPENDITNGLRDEVRADNVRVLLLGVLQRQAASQPDSLVVEDEQWLDSAFIQLLRLVSARVLRALIVVTRAPARSGRCRRLAAGF